MEEEEGEKVEVTLEDKVQLILMSFEDHLKEHSWGNWSATEWSNRFIKAFEEEAQKRRRTKLRPE